MVKKSTSLIVSLTVNDGYDNSVPQLVTVKVTTVNRKYEVAKKGSRRNLRSIESFGVIDKVLHSLKSINVTWLTSTDE